MEFAVAKALKPSLGREFMFQQQLCEEILCFNTNNNVVVGGGGGGGEDFSVDDLFDFSNGEVQHHYEQEQEYDDEEKESLYVSSQSQDYNNSNSSSVFSGELAVPVDDVAELEWVSHFVDDSLTLSDPECSLFYAVSSGSDQPKTMSEPEPRPKNKTTLHPLDMKITTKARTLTSKKPNPRVWSFSPLLSLSPSSYFPSMFCEPLTKKQKKWAKETQPCGAQLQRRCSHCHAQKTPQWRTGPRGPKTLCNACGVRYKSGRLFSEYRPACSPTFSSDIHSNSHRKVLEMRRRKEITTGPDAGLVQTQMVPSC